MVPAKPARNLAPAKPALERAAHVRGLALRDGSGEAAASQHPVGRRQRNGDAVLHVASSSIKDWLILK